MRKELFFGTALLSLVALAACDNPAISTVADTAPHVVSAEIHPGNTQEAPGAADTAPHVVTAEIHSGDTHEVTSPATGEDAKFGLKK